MSEPQGPGPEEIEKLLQEAQQALESINQAPFDQPAGVKPFILEDFAAGPPGGERASLDLLRDVELDVKIEFGRTHMYLDDVLRLRTGSVVPLDKPAGDPVDILVNGRMVAKGEVVVLNDNFCVRVAEIIAGDNPA